MLEQIGVGQQLLDNADRDRLGKRLRIGKGDGEIEVTEIPPAETFLDSQFLAVSRR
jgi:hypothetical protein